MHNFPGIYWSKTEIVCVRKDDLLICGRTYLLVLIFRRRELIFCDVWPSAHISLASVLLHVSQLFTVSKFNLVSPDLGLFPETLRDIGF